MIVDEVEQPEKKVNLNKVVDYLNSDVFKNNFMFILYYKEDI